MRSELCKPQWCAKCDKSFGTLCFKMRQLEDELAEKDKEITSLLEMVTKHRKTISEQKMSLDTMRATRDHYQKVVDMYTLRARKPSSDA